MHETVKFPCTERFFDLQSTTVYLQYRTRFTIYTIYDRSNFTCLEHFYKKLLSDNLFGHRSEPFLTLPSPPSLQNREVTRGNNNKLSVIVDNIHCENVPFRLDV